MIYKILGKGQTKIVPCNIIENETNLAGQHDKANTIQNYFTNVEYDIQSQIKKTR